MKRRRIVHAGAAPGVRLTLPDVDRRHVQQVLRLAVGSELEVLDGAGGAYRARYLGGDPARVEVLAAEPPLLTCEPLTVVLSVLRAARMDWAIEKLSELGVERLVPLLAGRAVAVPRPERWQRLARESAKQCGRARLMEVAPALTIAELLAAAPRAATRLLLDPAGEELGPAPLAAPAALVIGPEGGFAPDEVAALGGAFRRVRIGRSVLRAETAAVAGSAVVLSRMPG